jgi:hypothetical protein
MNFSILDRIKKLVLTFAVSKKEENYLEADFLDSTIEEQQDYQIVYNHSTQPSNHLPSSFFDNLNKLLYYLFLGLYGGDGRNKASKGVVGFSFRSTEFAFLYDFLIFCGVQQPKLA